MKEDLSDDLTAGEKQKIKNLVGKTVRNKETGAKGKIRGSSMAGILSIETLENGDLGRDRIFFSDFDDSDWEIEDG